MFKLINYKHHHYVLSMEIGSKKNYGKNSSIIECSSSSSSGKIPVCYVVDQ